MDNKNMNIVKLVNMLTYIDEDMWTIDYTDSYYLEDVLSLNNPSFSSVLKYISKQQNVPLKKFNFNNDTGGYAFNVNTITGHSLAHNFDAHDGPCIILWTAPSNGLKSMALVNPSILFSKFLWSKKLSTKKMLNALLAPYTCMSGINEAGVSIIGIPSWDGVVKQRNGKHEITPFIAIRAILDKCKSVDEAISFLKSYDMQETPNLNYSYQILDKEGNSALVDYTNNELRVIKNDLKDEDLKLLTSYEDKEKSQIITMLLSEKKGELNTADVMKTLFNICLKPVLGLSLKPKMTLWSGVYGCNTNTLSICYRMNYDFLYQFSINNPGEFTKYNVNLGSPIVNDFDMTSSDANVILKANNISKSFGFGGGKVRALNNVNLKIIRGELLVIIGNSGSGKTTLLNVLGGMYRPDNGKVFVDGYDISDFDDDELTNYRKENIGFIFQSFNLINELTALENVLLSLENEDKSKALALLDVVGLRDKSNKYPSNLSGGEQQRVSIARALAKNPKILFCDEPTGSLDYKTGKQILVELEKMSRVNGKTIVIVTHTREIGKMANRIIYMKNGQIDSVINNPKPISADEIEW